MSLLALAVLSWHLTVFGTAREPDEGTAAHIFQLMMAGQVPIIVLFAIVWLPRATKAALVVLAAQLVCAIVAFAPVFYFGL